MDSPLKQQTVTQVLNEDTTTLRKASDKTFVADQYKSMDVCYNPEIRDLVSGFVGCLASANASCPANPQLTVIASIPRLLTTTSSPTVL
jgi:hypothetical protein